MKKRILFLALLLMVFALPFQVYGQAQPNEEPAQEEVVTSDGEVVESDQSIGEEPEITSAVPDPAILQQLTENYYDSVSTYRNASDQFTIARTQYYQLNTLTSQNEALARGRELLRARAQVLFDYYSYIAEVLVQTKGIELADKEAMQEEVNARLIWLEEYREDSVRLQTRKEVNDQLAKMNEEEKLLQDTAYSAIALIKLGELQTALDNSVVLHEDLGVWLQTIDISATSRSNKERGLGEVKNLLQSGKNNLVEVLAYIRNSSNGNSFNDSSYTQFQQKAEYTYLQLRQAAAFMREVTTL